VGVRRLAAAPVDTPALWMATAWRSATCVARSSTRQQMGPADDGSRLGRPTELLDDHQVFVGVGPVDASEG
jgi:hypothetical protein